MSYDLRSKRDQVSNPPSGRKGYSSHKASMHGYDDAQLKQFGRQASAARVAAVMQSAFPEGRTL